MFRNPRAVVASLLVALSASSALASPAPDASASFSALSSADQHRQWIAEARARHPYAESEARMHAVMMCESGGRPTVVNPKGRYTGLFQYARRTWNDTWNIYRKDGILDPKAQIFATALAWQLDMQDHWECYDKTAGTP